jgi:hypothetical protein
MKKFIKKAIVLLFILAVAYPFAWIAASVGLIKDVEFGYYGEFNLAKHAIQEAGCAQKIEYSGVNKDVVLEEFHFKVTTKSGKVVRIRFDASYMDVNQVCYQPAGLSVLHPAYERDRRYRIEGLTEYLREKNIHVRELRGILCNIDKLEEVFITTLGDAKALREDDPYVWDYLRIEFPTEEGLRQWKYTDIREKDVSNWP